VIETLPLFSWQVRAMGRPAKNHDAELRKYPELKRFPEQHRWNVFKSAPSDQRARRSGWLKVIILKRKGPEYTWGRAYKVKNPGGPKLMLDSKQAAQEFLRSKTLLILDDRDELKIGGHGAGRLVSNPREDVELENLPPPMARDVEYWGIAAEDGDEGVTDGRGEEGDGVQGVAGAEGSEGVAESGEAGGQHRGEESMEEVGDDEPDISTGGSMVSGEFLHDVAADDDLGASELLDVGRGQKGFGASDSLDPNGRGECGQNGMHGAYVRSQISDSIDAILWRLKVMVAVLQVSQEDRSKLKQLSSDVERLKTLLISTESIEQETNL
jgi:hypothetical protein